MNSGDAQPSFTPYSVVSGWVSDIDVVDANLDGHQDLVVLLSGGGVAQFLSSGTALPTFTRSSVRDGGVDGAGISVGDFGT